MTSSLNRTPALHWHHPTLDEPLCRPPKGKVFVYTEDLDAVTCKRCQFRDYFQALVFEKRMEQYENNDGG